MDRIELRRFARVGAEARLQELRREMAAIVAQFPELRGRKAASVAAGNGGVKPRRRRAMSASARKAIAAAQRKRWAEWRKANRKND